MKQLDCLIIRQPYASLIAYGSKRWEFRSYNCSKRGLICVGSSKGKPLRTGDPRLNSISDYLPRGFVLATCVLVDSHPVTSTDLQKVMKGTREAKIGGYKITTLSRPLGEPLYDILRATKDPDWEMYAWVLRDVSPLKTLVPLQNDRSGSTWTTVEFTEEETFSKSLETFL